MTWGKRCFLYDRDGTLLRMPQRVADGLASGLDTMPQYAGQSIRQVTVILELEDKVPVRIIEVAGSIWHFDKWGSPQRAMAESAMEARVNYRNLKRQPLNAQVVSIRPRLTQKLWWERNRWEPGPKEINQIIHAIWPKDAGTDRRPVRLVTGTAKRRYPMSYEAQAAERECRKAIWEIERQIDDLNIHALKGLISNIESDMPDEVVGLSRFLWQGVAEAAKQKLEILKAYRTKKGAWYALAYCLRWDGTDRGVGEAHDLEEVECNGRDAAVEAARGLLRKYADQFSDNTTIEVEIRPAIAKGYDL